MRSTRGMDRLPMAWDSWLANGLGVLVATLSMAIGCGGGPPGDSLLGTWELTVNSCVVGMTFAAPASYEYDLVCPTPSGGFGLEAEVGTYAKTPSRITFTADKSTCTGAVKLYYLDYSNPDADRLSLVYSNSVEVLARVTPTGTGLATFGCWSMGAFTPMPFASVP